LIYGSIGRQVIAPGFSYSAVTFDRDSDEEAMGNAKMEKASIRIFLVCCNRAAVISGCVQTNEPGDTIWPPG
jgi:hypothetical protein